MGRGPLKGSGGAAPRRGILEDLERRRQERRLAEIKSGFAAAMSSVDKARAANEDHHRRRLDLVGEMGRKAVRPKAPKPASFAGAKGALFLKRRTRKR